MQSNVDTAKAAQEFRDSFSTLHLATCSSDGIPHASYSPYTLLPGDSFGIVTSRLAQHTQNLLLQGLCSTLFIESETDAHSPFARRRLTLRCNIIHHARDSGFFAKLIQQMQDRHGETALKIYQLPDFEAFQLVPCHAEYVEGFGRAWRFADGKLEQASLIGPDR